jgi:hypothetical protein
VAIAKNLHGDLDFFVRGCNECAARAVINERAIQPTCNDPLRVREVKPVLSRSFPPLLWISARAQKFFRDTDALALSRSRRMKFGARAKNFRMRRAAAVLLRVIAARDSAVAQAMQLRNFSEKMPSQRRIS